MSTRSLNKVLLIGNLTRDPNLRYTPNNTAVCSFGLATNRSWTSADGGEKQESVEYHNIVAWSKLAEICGQLLHKGDKIYVEGRLQTRDWRTEDGQERRTTEVIIDNMILLRSSSGQNDGEGSAVSASYSSSSNISGNKKTKKQSRDDADLEKPAETLSSDEAMSSDFSSVEDIADDVPF